MPETVSIRYHSRFRLQAIPVGASDAQSKTGDSNEPPTSIATTWNVLSDVA